MQRAFRCLRLVIPVVLAVSGAGCAGGPSREADADIMFRRTGAVADDVLTLTTPALVSRANGAYEIEAIAWFAGAGLDETGEVGAGDNAVFSIRFMDRGDISVLRTDDKRVSLRAEMGPEGVVEKAMLGSTSGTVQDAFATARNDEFQSGSWELLYDGPELVVGRIDLVFEKYRVQGNFRAPRLRP